MHAAVASFWSPRAGNDAGQYEDAFYPRDTGRRSARRLRFAVADGASESMLSGLWADLLVRSWCKARRRRLPQIIEYAAAAWEVELAAYLEERERADRPVQWFEEPGLERGAHATLLGLAFTTSAGEHGSWAAVALGDSCLFHVRDGALVLAFPVTSSAAFDSAPPLVPSRPAEVARVVTAASTTEGDWRVGDAFYLATDAAAAWFLREHEEGRAPWEELDILPVEDHAAFAAWAKERRGDKRLRNDDTTLLRVQVMGR